MKRKVGTFQEFKDYTLAVARGERKVDPTEPKVWVERIEGVNQGTGSDTINVIGDADTVTAGLSSGTEQGLVTFSGTNLTLADGGNKFTDTVVGFDQTAGDRIHLTTDTVANAVAHSTQVNGGADTMITLSDGSTILLKGVSHIDPSFFS